MGIRWPGFKAFNSEFGLSKALLRSKRLNGTLVTALVFRSSAEAVAKRRNQLRFREGITPAVLQSQ